LKKIKRKPPGAEKPKLKARLELEPVYDLDRTVDLGQRILKAQALTRAAKAKGGKQRNDAA
jgi:hypothetical protein